MDGIKIKVILVVSEIANDILVAVDERKNFILRTVFSVARCYFNFFSFFK